MSYLVLGSNSFAGSTFVNELLFLGEKVIGISRSGQPHLVLQPYADHPQKQNFSFYNLDLNQDFDDIKNLILKFKPKYIIDFASQSMVAESWIYPEQWYTTNIVAKAKLHNFLRTCDFLQRYIRISTPEVYGHSNDKIKENFSFNPTTPYAVSQAATDMSLTAFYKQYQFPVIFTRFANFYGPYQQLYRIIPKAILCGLLGKKLTLHGGGTSKRAFIYATDITNGILKVIQQGKLGETYHFSSGDCISIAELIKMICLFLNLQFESLCSLAPERPGKDFQYFMDTTKAETDLNWHPNVTLEKGIEKTITWIQNNIDVLKSLPHEYQHRM